MNPRDYVYSNLAHFIGDPDYCRYTLRDTVNQLVRNLRFSGVAVRCDEDPRKVFMGLEVKDTQDDDGNVYPECYYVWTQPVDPVKVKMYRDAGFEMVN